MRLLTIALGAILTFVGAVSASAAGLPLAPQQLELCRLHYRNITNNIAYDKARAAANSIQQLSIPQPPALSAYANAFAQSVGPTGEVKDSYGMISFIAAPADRMVRITIDFQCPPDTDPRNQGRQFPLNGDSVSLRNAAQLY